METSAGKKDIANTKGVNKYVATEIGCKTTHLLRDIITVSSH